MDASSASSEYEDESIDTLIKDILTTTTLKCASESVDAITQTEPTNSDYFDIIQCSLIKDALQESILSTSCLKQDVSDCIRVIKYIGYQYSKCKV